MSVRSQIVAAVVEGRLQEPFSPKMAYQALLASGLRCSIITVRNVLSRYVAGNWGNPTYFVRIERGWYRLSKPVRWEETSQRSDTTEALPNDRALRHRIHMPLFQHNDGLGRVRHGMTITYHYVDRRTSMPITDLAHCHVGFRQFLPNREHHLLQQPG